MKKVLCDVRNPAPGFCGYTGYGFHLDLNPRELRENVAIPEKAIESVIRAGLQVRIRGEEKPADVAPPAPADVAPPAPAAPADVAPPAPAAPLAEKLVESFSKKELKGKCDGLKIPNYGNMVTLSERLAEGRTAEELGV